MGTRGLYGIRKNGVDKCTYNHFDSYPDYLGRNVVEFCKNHSIEELHETFDKIVLVNESDKPTEKQINECIENGFCDFSVSSQSSDDWYCLLRNCQGDLDCLANAKEHAYMINNINFIKDSLFCEYAYIINLDDEVLEFYEGFQNEPQIGNRYGTGSAFHANPRVDGKFDSARVGDIDFSMDMEKYNEAIRYWEVVVEKQPLREDENPDDFRNWYRDGYYEEYYKDKETYAKICASYNTYSVVTPDGKWHEKGEMLWFGMSSETGDESLDWDLHYKERFLDTADPDWTLTIVDCHI